MLLMQTISHHKLILRQSKSQYKKENFLAL